MLLNLLVACNVLYINSIEMESLTGPAALTKAIQMTFNDNNRPKTTLVHFRVSTQGITLTDNQRRSLTTSEPSRVYCYR